MHRWIGKVAVVTGANGGIGSVIAKDLAKAGMVTVGLDLRAATSDPKKNLHAIKCDITSESDTKTTFKRIQDTFGGVDVLVNCAGIVRSHNLFDQSRTSDIRAVLNTNIMGVVLCSQWAYQSMVQRSVGGHIVNINSVAGHIAIDFPKLNIYPASKHAVTAITETMRQEMRDAGTRIKVTSVSPGGVRTEMVTPVELVPDMTFLEPADISQAVLYAIGTPPHVQVHEITVRPLGEPF